MSNDLKQKLGLFSAIMVVVSAMIGSGVFKKISNMSAELGQVNWVLFAWAVAGGITLIGSLCNAEVAGLIPKSGGQYVYFSKIYGRFFSFLFGWASFSVIQTATAASVAYIFAESLNSILNLQNVLGSLNEFTLFSLGDFSIQPFNNFNVKIIAILLISFLTWMNYRGVEYGEKISNVLGVTVIIGILIIIIFGVFNSSQPLNEIAQSPNAIKEISISTFFAAMMSAFWAYEGWNNVGYLSGEIKNPKKNVPMAFLFGTSIVIMLYLLVNWAYFQINGINFYSQLENGKIAAVESLNTVWKYGGFLISILIVISTFNSTNNSVMSAARIYHAMANDGLFIPSAGKTHPKYKTPHLSLIYQWIWCIVLILSGSFDLLTEMLVFVAFIFYGCGALGVIILRKKMNEVERPFKVPLYPILPIIFVIFSFVLVILTLINAPVQSLIGMGLVILGIPLYLYYNKKQVNKL